MRYLGYLALGHDLQPENKSGFESKAKKLKLAFAEVVADEEPKKLDWQLRGIKNLIDKAKDNDTIVVYDIFSLTHSMLQLIRLFKTMQKKKLSLLILKTEQTFHFNEKVKTKNFLEFATAAESEYEKERAKQPSGFRMLSGVPLGRPKGKKNKSRKLDKYLPEIEKYLALKISKASIAKLIGCHPQTLYNYLDEKKLATAEE